MPENEAYLTSEEEKTLGDLLECVIPDTLRFWKLTRIDGISASMAHDGNVNVALVKTLDVVADAIVSECKKELAAND
jgi:hypothetical protein